MPAENPLSKAEQLKAIAKETLGFFEKINVEVQSIVGSIQSIVQEQEEAVKQQNKFLDSLKASDSLVGKLGVGLSAGWGKLKGWGAAAKDALKSFSLKKVVVTGLLTTFSLLLGMLFQFDKRTREFVKQLGVGRDVAQDFATQQGQVAAATAHLGIKGKEVGEAQVALAKAYKQSGKVLDKSLVASTAKLVKGTELGANEAAGLMRAFDVGGKKGDKAMTKIAKKAVAAGVPFKDIAEDIGKNTELMAKFGTEGIGEAAIMARRLGIQLEDAAGVANKFLDPMDAITNANRLNLLFGTDINGMELQRLANTGDLAGMMETLTNELDLSSDKFNQMSAIEKQALAEATGLSEQKLATMLKEREELEAIAEEQNISVEEALKLQDALSPMEQLMGRLRGIWEEISVAIAPIVMDMLDPMLESFKKMLTPLEGQETLVEKVKGQFTEWMNIIKNSGFVQWLQNSKDHIGDIKAKIAGVVEFFKKWGVAIAAIAIAVPLLLMFGPGLASIAGGLAAVGAVAAPAALGIGVLTLAGLAFAAVVWALGEAFEATQEGWNSFFDNIVKMVPVIKTVFEGLALVVGTVIEKIAGGISEIMLTMAASMAIISGTSATSIAGSMVAYAGGLVAVANANVGAAAGGLLSAGLNKITGAITGEEAGGGEGGGGEARVLNVVLNVDGKKFGEVMADVLL